jgi:hypothetical protein
VNSATEDDKAAQVAAIKSFEAKLAARLPGATMVADLRGVPPENVSLDYKGSIEPHYAYVRIHDKLTHATYQSASKINTYSYNPLVASFKLVQMPGCCGVLVSTESQVQIAYRGKGIGTFLQEIKEFLAKRFQVGSMIATVVDGNAAEERILNKTGWIPVYNLVNPKSGNLINVWKKEVVYG